MGGLSLASWPVSEPPELWLAPQDTRHCSGGERKATPLPQGSGGGSFLYLEVSLAGGPQPGPPACHSGGSCVVGGKQLRGTVQSQMWFPRKFEGLIEAVG